MALIALDIPAREWRPNHPSSRPTCSRAYLDERNEAARKGQVRTHAQGSGATTRAALQARPTGLMQMQRCCRFAWLH
jgi:hypothetical protein